MGWRVIFTVLNRTGCHVILAYFVNCLLFSWKWTYWFCKNAKRSNITSLKTQANLDKLQKRKCKKRITVLETLCSTLIFLAKCSLVLHFARMMVCLQRKFMYDGLSIWPRDLNVVEFEENLFMYWIHRRISPRIMYIYTTYHLCFINVWFDLELGHGVWFRSYTEAITILRRSYKLFYRGGGTIGLNELGSKRVFVRIKLGLSHHLLQ